MAETDVVTLINAIPSLIEQLSKAFSELESHENASVDKAQFKEIQEHFKQLEAMVVEKCLELDIREKAFCEQESHVLMLVKSRETEVATMEQDLLDRIQKLKDAAASAISEARGNHKLTPHEPVDVGDSEDSQLTESFPIAPLLKAHLKDLRRSLQGKGGSSGNAENNANAQELAALKDIIQCIKEYNLEADYPVDPLQRRIAQLESAKTNYKKRSSAEPDRPRHPKKPHTNGAYGGSRGSSSNPSRQAHAQGFGARTAYGGVSERYPPPTAYDYQAPTSIPYPQQAAYDPRAYYLPPDERVAPTSASGYAGSAMPGTARQPYI